MQKVLSLLFILLANCTFAQQTSTIVRFAPFQSQLDAQARQQIEKLLGQFSPNDELQIDIYSYTDDKEAQKQSNRLSEKRNEVVLTYLLQKNYKIKATHTFIGGKIQAEVPNNSDENRAQNRRTLVIVNKIVAVQPKYYRYEKQVGVIPSPTKPNIPAEIFALKTEVEAIKPVTEDNIPKALPQLPE
jgi:hypothetical protein